MFLELIFTDVDSLRDYLEHYSYKYGGERRWRDLFAYGFGGCARNPFIWYSPLTKEYHVDIRVNYRTEAYTRLSRYRYNKINDYACFVQWDSRYSKNSMVMRTFEDKWCWSNEALLEMMTYGDIYEKLSININVYEAKKYREYAPMFRIKRKKDDLSIACDCFLQNNLLRQEEKELRDKFIKNGIVKGSDVNEALGLDSHTGKFDDDLVVTKAFEPDLECNKTYMITARANGKGIGQALEALKQEIINQYTPEETGIVAVSPKYFYGMYPTKPRHNDLAEKTLKHFDTDVTAMVECYKIYNSNLQAKVKKLKERMNIMFGVDLNRIPEIKDVKFNNPATIVFWADGTKTVVKRQKGDRFDKEKGLAMAIVKKLYGNKGKYNDLFKKWIKEDK